MLQKVDFHVIFLLQAILKCKNAQALSYGANYIAVDGTYDDANRIAAQIGDSKGNGIVNINMRSYYVEGSKTNNVIGLYNMMIYRTVNCTCWKCAMLMQFVKVLKNYRMFHYLEMFQICI